MTRTTLFACEIPFARDGSYNKHSMQPFLAGLCELHGARLLYRTFTEASELAALLSKTHMPAADGQRVIVYVSAHGSGSCLFSETGKAIYMLPVAKKAARHMEGVWIGACGVGGASAVKEFVRHGGASWAGGFTCAVEWKDTVLLDLAVLQAALSRGAPRTRNAVVGLFSSALQVFAPNWVVDKKPEVTLSKALRVWGRNHTTGPNVADLTTDLLRKLKWPAGQGA